MSFNISYKNDNNLIYFFFRMKNQLLHGIIHRWSGEYYTNENNNGTSIAMIDEKDPNVPLIGKTSLIEEYFTRIIEKPMKETFCFSSISYLGFSFILSILQFIFFIYSTISLFYFGLEIQYTQEADEFGFSILCLSHILIIIAILLYIVGLVRRKHLLLIPNIILHLSFIILTFFIAIYIFILIIGGISINVNILIRKIDHNAGSLSSIMHDSDNIDIGKKVGNFKTILYLTFGIAIIFFIFQFFYFNILRRCFIIIRNANIKIFNDSKALTEVSDMNISTNSNNEHSSCSIQVEESLRNNSTLKSPTPISMVQLKV
uniref:MARVEL domain-containing protein n=1 Tax=Strongyloides stercoralis TaxID=6248 RepID=A0A913HD88_STRER